MVASISMRYCQQDSLYDFSFAYAHDVTSSNGGASEKVTPPKVLTCWASGVVPMPKDIVLEVCMEALYHNVRTVLGALGFKLFNPEYQMS